jgi:4-amino-4-deoxy-L-arabinose transferase-like glycosyltransferase
VELRHVDAFRLAGAVIRPRVAAAAILLLIALRLVMAGLLPLSADEAYYWLWSRHLAAGYYDHPPAIAFLIRAGTLLFGDTPFGVRLFPVLLSLPASWWVWRTALMFQEPRRAALAALLFNLTLMIGVEALVATPDAPSIAFSAAYVWCLARTQNSGDARWWLAAGAAAGLGMLSKYAALFLGAGTLVWLIAEPRARVWLRSPWPYLGGLVAAVIFAPNLIWQARHHWMTFAFQFGRMAGGHLTLRYLAEFLAAQASLATPLIFLLACAGLWRASRRGQNQFLLAMLVWTGFAYFLIHALHERVQGNWPCFLYPVVAILAAGAFDGQGVTWRWLSWSAAPLACVLLLLIYAQALFEWLPLRNDPLPRLLGRGFPSIARTVAEAIQGGRFDAVLTTDYETTAWLRFYQPNVKVIQIDEPWRYPDAPAPGPLLKKRLLYLVEARRDRAGLVRQSFTGVGSPTAMRGESNSGSPLYELFPVLGPKRMMLGEMP